MKTIFDKAEGIVKHKKVACIGSVSKGCPFIKAAFVVRREGFKVFYFVTKLSAERTEQFFVCPDACLYFFNRIFHKGIMLGGKMEVLCDKAAKDLICKPSCRFFFRGDPDYCVLKFTAETGRYYSALQSESFGI